jgi:hypothetical protein
MAGLPSDHEIEQHLTNMRTQVMDATHQVRSPAAPRDSG